MGPFTVLTLMAVERFEGNADIAMVATGSLHSVAVGSEGCVWTWGLGLALGHNDRQDRHVPTLLAGTALNGGKTDGGSDRKWGTLGLWQQSERPAGNHRLRFSKVGISTDRGGGCVGGSPVRMAACGEKITTIVTKEGYLWPFGKGGHGALGLNDIVNRRVPTQSLRPRQDRFCCCRITPFGGIH